MNGLFTYSILSAIIIAIFYCILLLLPSSAIPPRISRRIILTGYAVSLILPMILIAIPHISPWAGTVPNINAIMIGTPIIGIADARQPLSTWHIPSTITTLNTIVTACMFALTLWSIARIAILKRSAMPCSIDGATAMVHHRDTLAPFSWGRDIFLHSDDAADPRHHLTIAHERAHIIHHHWIDILTGSFITAIQWYNPIAWRILNMLRDIHEYQADAYVLDNGADAYDYQMFLIEKTAGARFASLANSLNHSSLNKRITMMLSKKPRRTPRVRIASAAMIGALAIGALSFSGIAQVINDMSASPFDSETASIGKVKDFSLTVNTPATSTRLDEKPDDAMVEPEIKPEYAGGQIAMMKFLIENLRYPESAMKEKEQGMVLVGFNVDTDGSISDIHITKSVSPALDKEAMRVVSLMPKFNPGKQDGKAVKCVCQVPIHFKLN